MSAARPTVSGVYRPPSAANNNDLRRRNPRLGCRAEVPESMAPRKLLDPPRRKISGPPKSDCYFPRYFRYFLFAFAIFCYF
jgi:hypothetical protein